jgi:hypothetical protein
LKTAAHATANRGRSARVATTVAIEFAESWKPLVKSNSSAIVPPPVEPPDHLNMPKLPA